MSRDTALTGAAGEHYVAFRLAASGYAVGITTRGTRNVDMVAANPDTGKSISIDTKTMRKAFQHDSSNSWWKWRMGIHAYQKLKYLKQNDFFYILVDLKDDPTKTPDIFIVPSNEMQNLLEPHPKGVNPASGNLTDVWCVIFDKDASKYNEKWDIVNKALI